MSRRTLVMVVDDDLELRQSLAELLDEDGYDTVCFGSGQAALDYLLGPDRRPGLILLDLVMPGMNGWDFRQQLRGQPTLAQIPVVAITAGRLPARSPEADTDLLFKPLRLGRLLEVVRQRCRRPRPADAH